MSISSERLARGAAAHKLVLPTKELTTLLEYFLCHIFASLSAPWVFALRCTPRNVFTSELWQLANA